MILKHSFADKLFIEGYFESEKKILSLILRMIFLKSLLLKISTLNLYLLIHDRF